MIDKNKVIEGLKHQNFIVSNAFYEYVCNLHLYDDKDINKTFMDFIKNNYDKINFMGLRFSKLNYELIQCLIDIHLNEKNEKIKYCIGDILVNHYSLIKDLDYDFEKMLNNEYDVLFYRKLKHFSLKDSEQLLRLYTRNVGNYALANEDTMTTEIIRDAIAANLIQTEDGIGLLYTYIKLMGEKQSLDQMIDIHMPYLYYPLWILAKPEYAALLLGLYLQNMETLEYINECNYYFSNICSDEFVNMYLTTLKKIRKSKSVNYFYDIGLYLDSEVIDKFLFEELRNVKNIEIKENIICILAEKFNEDIIPYALEYVKKGSFHDEECFVASLSPLLVFEGKDDEISKSIIDKSEKYNKLYNEVS